MLDAIIHELGHTYGIQHTFDVFLMNESYLENLLAKNEHSDEPPNFPYGKEEGDIFLLINFFKFEVPDNFLFDVNCRTSSNSPSNDSPNKIHPKSEVSLFKQFKIPNLISTTSEKNPTRLIASPSETRSIEKKLFGYIDDSGTSPLKICFNILRTGNKYSFELTKEVNNVRQSIGVVDDLVRHDKVYKDLRPIIRFWIPKDQHVFDLRNEEIANSFTERAHDIGLIQLDTQFKGTYRINATGQTRPFFIQAKNFWRINFGGELDGKFYLDLEEEF